MVLNKSCSAYFFLVLLLSFSISKVSAAVDDLSNKTLEKRLHSIYVNHYSKSVLDSDWFNIIEAIESQTYTVLPGDTLWGISEIYFGEGNYWSKLWSVNKSITNPHLIFAGDVIHFHTGSFKKPPGIEVESSSGAVLTDGSNDETTESADSGENSMDQQNVTALPLPDVFRSRNLQKRVVDPIIEFVPRPERVYKDELVLNGEILAQSPDIVGSIKSIGQNRILTAESTIVIIQSEQDLVLGATYSVVRYQPPDQDEAHRIYFQATVKISKKIDKDLFEGNVILQLDSINIGDAISKRSVKTVSLKLASQDSVEVPLKILSEKRTIWSAGDTVFFKIIDGGSVNINDIVKISNKHTDSIEYYLSNGYVKIVSLSPPFATGTVVSSREHIRSNSVSRPTYTGWSIW